jgi:hypothetical protein
MLTRWLLALFAGLLFFSTAHAQLFKCTMPNGSIEYQSLPCISGKQSGVDTTARKIVQQHEDEEKERAEKKAADAAAATPPVDQKALLKQALQGLRESDRNKKFVFEENKIPSKGAYSSQGEPSAEEIYKIRTEYVKTDRQKIKEIQECDRSGRCTLGDYRELLIGRPKGMIGEALSCRSSNNNVYCDLRIEDFGRTRTTVVELMFYGGSLDHLPKHILKVDRVTQIRQLF